MDPYLKEKYAEIDKETKERQIIIAFLLLAIGCSGSPGIFFFIIAGLSLYRSDLIKAAWNRILPGEKIRFKTAIIIGFVLIGILCFIVQYDHNIDSTKSSHSANRDSYYAPYSPTPSSKSYSAQQPTHTPIPTPIPTPRPTPRPTPSPTPFQPREDGRGISFEEFMQEFEEYKRSGGSGYSDESWGEDITTNEITGDLGLTAYWTPNGKSYHLSRSCPSLSRSKDIRSGTLQDALNAGKTDPCNNCAY